MTQSSFIKFAKKSISERFLKGGYRIIGTTEYDRFVMRDNLAGLLTRACATDQSLTPEEREFLSFVVNFKGITLSQLFQDLFAFFVSKERRGGYFVEVGVGDGIAHSNTCLLEVASDWRGMLIEPNFALWDTIKKNRRAALAPYACSSSEGMEIFHRVATPELSYIGSSAPNDDLNRHVLESRAVRIRTLDSILEEYKTPKYFDYISIDVEGHELEVLDGFDVERWSPQAITIEYNNDSRRADAIRKRLAGYTQVMPSLSGCDLWFIRSEK